MWKTYHIIESQEQLKELLAKATPDDHIIAGGTDLMVEIRNGKWPNLGDLFDISRMSDSDQIYEDADGSIHLGCLVTHNDVIASDLIRRKAFPLYQACWHVATPQIRNTATVAGNLVTASPANDTICPLMAMDAELVLASLAGERRVKLKDFYLGVRKTTRAQNEFVKEIIFPALDEVQEGNFKKSGLRNAQVIATLNATVLLTLEEGLVREASITLGSVAPTIIHAEQAETYLRGKRLDEETAAETGRLAAEAAKPITDIRASEAYRLYMTGVLVKDALTEILRGEIEAIPEKPTTLSTRETQFTDPAAGWDGGEIQTDINGKTYTLEAWEGLTLLNFLREKLMLTGSKPGCEEGECGACTIHLDDKAVLSCLVPWPRAHNAKIRTIEGVASTDTLHPVQQAFIDHGAVQCGYCTPGFVMAAVKMLEELDAPSEEVIKLGISGNLCRCTGYYKIVEAIEDAASKMGRSA